MKFWLRLELAVDWIGKFSHTESVAPAAPPPADAVMVLPARPKLTPFAFENTIWSGMSVLAPPAEKFKACWAVMVDPFSPKLTRLLFEKTILPKPALLAPAENVTLPAAALGASKTIEPFVIATVTAPDPRKITLLALVVPLEEPVVLPVPNIVIC